MKDADRQKLEEIMKKLEKGHKEFLMWSENFSAKLEILTTKLDTVDSALETLLNRN